VLKHKKAVALAYIAAGLATLMDCVGSTIYAAARGNLFMGTLKAVERLFSGISHPADVYVVWGFLLPVLALVLLGIILILMGVDLRRDVPLLPGLHESWPLLFALLVGLQFWSCFVFGVFSSAIAIIPLALIFAYALFRNKLDKLALSMSQPGRTVVRGLFFRYSLVLVAVLLIGNFILIAYLHYRFLGQLFEF
jgi:hypothetical protein